MGALTSRQNVGVEEVDISVNHAYRYPPKSGNYFSSHFIMGGERFDTAQPEMYLFGENTDLNFLGSRPAPFPYPAPSASEPSRTLKALVNIRKESLRFVRVPEESSVCLKKKEEEEEKEKEKEKEEEEEEEEGEGGGEGDRNKKKGRRGGAPPSTQFNIEFTFDCDVRCAITIMYFCSEEVTSTGLIYTPRDSSMNSETFHYKRGSNQQFSQVSHVFEPSKHGDESLTHSFDRELTLMPVVIYCLTEEGEEPYQSHVTIAVVDKHADGHTLKPLKQKLFVDGLCYLLQEIYGIENKNADSKLLSPPDDDPDDNGAECVICMCDLRDTLILPCRHLCLCNCCADSLRYQANNCPICRAPFRALLQIKALQKITSSSSNAGGAAPPPSAAAAGGGGGGTNNETGDPVPPGYEAVSLIEALNGPSVTPLQPPAPPYQNMYVQLPQSAAGDEEEEEAEGGGGGGGGGAAAEPEDVKAGGNSESPPPPLPPKGVVAIPPLEDPVTRMTDRATPSSSSSSSSSSPPDGAAGGITKGSANQVYMSVLMARESEEDEEEEEDEKEEAEAKKRSCSSLSLSSKGGAPPSSLLDYTIVRMSPPAHSQDKSPPAHTHAAQCGVFGNAVVRSSSSGSLLSGRRAAPLKEREGEGGSPLSPLSPPAAEKGGGGVTSSSSSFAETSLSHEARGGGGGGGGAAAEGATEQTKAKASSSSSRKTPPQRSSPPSSSSSFSSSSSAGAHHPPHSPSPYGDPNMRNSSSSSTTTAHEEEEDSMLPGGGTAPTTPTPSASAAPPAESVSLPGTPLSRSSDVSAASSASSTRALLLISHPSAPSSSSSSTAI